MQTAAAVLSFNRSLQASGLAARTAAVLLGSALIAAAAQVQVPMFPVPMTMQTFAVLAIAMLYGSRLGALTVIAYLVEGALGLPVFAGGQTLALILAKPFTVGYLVGFVAAAFLAGRIAERTASLAGAALAVVAGTLTIYAFGISWLAVMLGGDVAKAFGMGALPFLVGDLVKGALAMAVRESAGRISLRIGSSR
jgi:biotin transport system substrate-specific component